ncbi:MAG: hypothetical protein LKJ47_04890 [Bifidobacteriaceae bacterium]|jgi:hypothetical protein|nr:hypothetical protein [Bifidobacteriaceae bacterium]
MSQTIKRATQMMRDGRTDQEIRALTNLNPAVITSIRESLGRQHLLQKKHQE